MSPTFLPEPRARTDAAPDRESAAHGGRSEDEADFRLLFENMDGGFALHEVIRDSAGTVVDYRFLRANPAFHRLTGLGNVVGRTIREILPTIEPHWIERYGAVATTGWPDEFEDHMPGLNRWFAVRAFCPRLGRFAVLFHDITERKAEQARQRISEERYRALFNQSADAVFVHEAGPDGRGRFVEINEVACARLGYSREELLARSPTDIDAGLSDTELAAIVERLKRGESVCFEHAHLARDGRRIPVEVHAQAIALQSRPAILSVVRDISERKRLADERLAMERQIQQTQKLESLGILAGGIAHDFNNILMAILGNVELAADGVPAASPARAHLADIEKAARRAADLCRQMLAYSGKGRFVIAALDLNPIIADMTHMLEVSISKKVSLRTNLAPDLPAVEADATQMRQVLMNLVINAAESCGAAGGAVSITTGVMDCDAAYLKTTLLREERPAGRYVYFEVADTGCGIPPDKVARIFDPFFTTKSAGRGLGLAAVLGIVRGHRGVIKLYSEPGKGTTFKLLFPASARPAGPIETPAARPPAWRGSGIALVADDEDASRNIAAKMLERLGFSVIPASDGREAVERFADARGRIAFVLLDLTMPRMDGTEAFRELRRLDPNVRVILTSGYNEQNVTQWFVGKGLAGFIQKPYQIADLSATVERVLNVAVPGAS